jgi:hypothetical protein
MPNEAIQNESLIKQKVTYTLEMNGKFFLIENVPARVNVETGNNISLQKPLTSSNKSCGRGNSLELLHYLYMSSQI